VARSLRRFKKLDGEWGQAQPNYSALILAAAGVKRMGWQERITQLLSSADCLHAVGQGALAVEVRKGDKQALMALSALNDRRAALANAAERALMRRLEGGCSAPVAAHAQVDGLGLSIEAAVWSLDGRRTVRASGQILLSDTIAQRSQGATECAMIGLSVQEWAAAEEAGLRLAGRMLAQGAGEILREAHEACSNGS